ncbi:MAG: DUF4846 domain-containing protein [Myxococcota bacterium]|nr:DUF4846 domain-containing protein [Myxococcota bacterium]
MQHIQLAVTLIVLLASSWLLAGEVIAENGAVMEYAFVEDAAETLGGSLSERFDVPEGFTRVALKDGSFGAWLRELPLLEGTQVWSYDGRVLDAPSAAVVALDVGSRDLQQCADSILRLRAEYLWAAGRQDEIAFHFTSGDRSAWSDWSEGERFRIGDGRVERTRSATRSTSRENFKKYLWHLFTYASTRSMSKDAQLVEEAELLEVGDFFVQGGSPGHAVLILDIAESADGRRVALLGQGYMPAQSFHVLRAEGAAVLGEVWFLLPGPGESLKTPSWPAFLRSEVRRF